MLTEAMQADLDATGASSAWATRLDGGKLHALDYGGDGRPLVILPGITTPAIAFDFVATRLCDLARPIVLDHRGRGLSDDATSFTLDDHAADVNAVVEALALMEPIILGHSLGARVAAAYAVRFMSKDPLILCDPPMSGPGRPYPTTLEMFLAQLDDAVEGTTRERVRSFWPRWPDRELDLRVRWLASCTRASISGTHQGFETEEFESLWQELAGENLYLMYGENSPVVTADDVVRLRKLNPQAQLVGAPGAAHMLFWDSFESSVALVRGALARLL